MFLVAGAGVDLVTTISAVLAYIGNVDPGLRQVGEEVLTYLDHIPFFQGR